MEKIRIGVIGTGNMGKNHVRVLAELKDEYDLQGVYDENHVRAEEIASLFGTNSFQSMEDLLNETDAVVIAVPSSLHKEIGKKVAESGVSALIEKPLATSCEDAEILKDVFENKGLKLSVGHIERFNPVVLELKKILESKQITFIEARRFSSFDNSGRITDTGVVEDLMIHDIDLILHLLNQPDMPEISSAGEIIRSDRLDFASAMLKFSSQKHAIVSASRISQMKERSLYIQTEDSNVYADLLAKTIDIQKSASVVEDVDGNRYRVEGVTQKIFVPIVEPLKKEHIEFGKYLRNEAGCPVSPIEAIKAISICEQIIQGR